MSRRPQRKVSQDKGEGFYSPESKASFNERCIKPDNNVYDDDEYSPTISDGQYGQANCSRHPDNPALLYIYEVLNINTGVRYLKVGYTQIPEDKCCERSTFLDKNHPIKKKFG